MAKEEKKKSRISDRWIPAGVLVGIGLGLGFALSIILRREERE